VGGENSFVFDLQPKLSASKNAWKETTTLARVNTVIKSTYCYCHFVGLIQINKSGPWACTLRSTGEDLWRLE
jgi:hypothetical protein